MSAGKTQSSYKSVVNFIFSNFLRSGSSAVIRLLILCDLLLSFNPRLTESSFCNTSAVWKRVATTLSLNFCFKERAKPDSYDFGTRGYIMIPTFYGYQKSASSPLFDVTMTFS